MSEDRYAPPNEQLIVELYTGDIKTSCAFYRAFGFEIVREESNFIVLRWEDSMLFLEEVKNCPPSEHQVGNIRVMVANVDHYWELATKLGARVIRPIADRYYGLRDFTIVGPDGIGLRFGTRLPDSH
ncbi:MAG TPA: VOC family protein [Blastocatellia bacterium]|nr:VOC family protein [Blastocatellia bacterium]